MVRRIFLNNNLSPDTLQITPPLFDLWGSLGLDEATFSCTIKELNSKSPKKFLFLVAFLLPSVVIVVCYSAIFYKVETGTFSMMTD